MTKCIREKKKDSLPTGKQIEKGNYSWFLLLETKELGLFRLGI